MKIGWIGTGVMGVLMAGRLLAARHDLCVFNRTKEKAEPLITGGAEWCASPATVAAHSEIVFSMVGLPTDVETVYLGAEGLLAAEGLCRIVVDMSTSRPSLAKAIAGESERRGKQSLDAPVSGGPMGAKEGKLAIMVGGKKEVFDEVLPLFQQMGSTISHLGGHGAGQQTKMCNQIILAANLLGVCESLLYAAKFGLDQQAVIDIVSKGAANSFVLNSTGPRIVRENYDPLFTVDHFIKDLGIALDEARAEGLAFPGLALAHQLYLAVKAQGGGQLGINALYKALKTLNGDV